VTRNCNSWDVPGKRFEAEDHWVAEVREVCVDVGFVSHIDPCRHRR
jgi:hypothetical protein